MTSQPISHAIMILLACAYTLTGYAQPARQERPKPLPRPELQPISVSKVQQIQGVGQAVLAAKGAQTPDPRTVALRQALLDLRKTIEPLRGPANADSQSLRICPEGKKCPEQSVAEAPSNLDVVTPKRHTLTAAIAGAEGDPKLAHLVAKARELDAKLGAALAAPVADRAAQLQAFYEELDPKSLSQLKPASAHIIEPTFHTLTQHRPGVKGITK